MTRFRNSLPIFVCTYTVGCIKPNYVSLSVLVSILGGVSCWFLAFGVG